MSVTINAKVYVTETSNSANSCTLSGPTHTYAMRDQAKIKRIMPNETTAYSGNSGMDVSWIRDVTLTGAKTVKGAAVYQAGRLTWPVGGSTTDRDTFLTDIAGLCGLAATKELLISGKFTY